MVAARAGPLPVSGWHHQLRLLARGDIAAERMRCGSFVFGAYLAAAVDRRGGRTTARRCGRCATPTAGRASGGTESRCPRCGGRCSRAATPIGRCSTRCAMSRGTSHLRGAVPGRVAGPSREGQSCLQRRATAIGSAGDPAEHARTARLAGRPVGGRPRCQRVAAVAAHHGRRRWPRQRGRRGDWQSAAAGTVRRRSVDRAAGVHIVGGRRDGRPGISPRWASVAALAISVCIAALTAWYYRLHVDHSVSASYGWYLGAASAAGALGFSLWALVDALRAGRSYR